MEIDPHIRSVISEYTFEGYLYLYDEQPENMKLVEDYLKNTFEDVCGSIYRRTDYAPILRANVGDTIVLERVSSWSYNTGVPNAMYDGIYSRMLILNDVRVRGLDLIDISFYKDEEEMLLAPSELLVIDIQGDVIKVAYQ